MSAKFPRGGEQTHSQPSVYFLSQIYFDLSRFYRYKDKLLCKFVFLVSGDCCVAPPCGAMELSAVCDCGISGSYSLFLTSPQYIIWRYDMISTVALDLFIEHNSSLVCHASSRVFS